MNTTSFLARAAGAALVLLAVPLARASSVDDSAGRVVVPYVAAGNGLEPRVQVTNHDPDPIKVRVLWVGEQSGSFPGRRTCTTLSVPGLTMMSFDPLSMCGLSAPAIGMMVLFEDSPGPVRISARALVDSRSPMSHRILQSVFVAGLPLANVEGADSILIAGGLRSRGAGMAQPLVTDCYVGTLFGASGSGAVITKVDFKDSDGNGLGSLPVVLKPFELVELKDVFRAIGYPSTIEGVRAEFRSTGGNDAVVAYCLTSMEGMIKQDHTIALSMGQVADPQDEVRKRQFTARETPARGPFLMLPPPFNAKQTHGLYVRHPDTVRCSVAMDLPPGAPPPGVSLEIAAVSPDRVRITSPTPSSRVDFATDVHGTVAGGVSDMWGLEVDWPAPPPPPAPAPPLPVGSVPYRISCLSGNGTSLGDLLIPVAP
jgi:hypothetical protein